MPYFISRSKELVFLVLLFLGKFQISKCDSYLLQIDFSRILCSHEHFVALNLPSPHPQVQSTGECGNFYSGASSPTPSVKSTDSQSSFVSHGKNILMTLEPKNDKELTGG